MRLRLDDNARHVYIWYGPKIDFKIGVPLTFKGRALPEWGMLAAGIVFLFPFSAYPIALLQFSSGLIAAPVRIAATWWCASAIAERLYARFVNRDRPPRYLAGVVISETARIVRACGHIDRIVVAVAVPIWFVVVRATARFFPGPTRLVPLVAAAFIAAFIARRVVARLEPPERYWRRRQTIEAAKPVTGSRPVLQTIDPRGTL